MNYYYYYYYYYYYNNNNNSNNNVDINIDINDIVTNDNSNNCQAQRGFEDSPSAAS